MMYTIKIDARSEQAQSIINLLNTLALDYDFLHIEADNNSNGLTHEQETELDKRYEYYLQNPNIGKSWKEVKENL